jgi:hypothetical protein
MSHRIVIPGGGTGGTLLANRGAERQRIFVDSYGT